MLEINQKTTTSAKFLYILVIVCCLCVFFIMSNLQSDDIVDTMLCVEREDPLPQQFPRHGSTSTKDDLLVSFLSDLRRHAIYT